MTDFIMLKNARVSFPHFFKKPIINGEEGKCGGAFMLHNEDHKALIDKVLGEVANISKEKFKGKKLPDEKLCIRAGEDKGRDEYEGYHVISANSKGFPPVVAANGQTIIQDEEDSPIYSGCRVNAKIRLWAQDNKYGKRINAELISVQFAGDDDPLDAGYVSAEQAVSGFEDLSGGDDDWLEGDAA